uniref:Uncharacterized protein n=1 Tax=Siphoviridae sp. ctAUQ2 TaxID=2826182 RepID=A0A8S5MZS8_9CAUD|nr:MAG TPA: hypothetical protein [Siphoviridae sp. ctAUQ2]
MRFRSRLFSYYLIISSITQGLPYPSSPCVLL